MKIKDAVKSDKFTLKLQFWLSVFWAVNLPPVILLYVFVGNDTFQRLILLYITLVSIWANFANHWVGWLTERARLSPGDQAAQSEMMATAPKE